MIFNFAFIVSFTLHAPVVSHHAIHNVWSPTAIYVIKTQRQFSIIDKTQRQPLLLSNS